MDASGNALDAVPFLIAGGMGYQDDRIIEECKAMVAGYLAPLLDP
jgi:hypothetical protein